MKKKKNIFTVSKKTPDKPVIKHKVIKQKRMIYLQEKTSAGKQELNPLFKCNTIAKWGKGTFMVYF